jgi:hypothetical protein
MTENLVSWNIGNQVCRVRAIFFICLPIDIHSGIGILRLLENMGICIWVYIQVGLHQYC